MKTAIVKWFNDSKGFGFLSPEDGGFDLFVHHTEIQCEGFKTLREGDRVSYDVKSMGPKGNVAGNVRPILVEPMSDNELHLQGMDEALTMIHQMLDNIQSNLNGHETFAKQPEAYRKAYLAIIDTFRDAIPGPVQNNPKRFTY